MRNSRMLKLISILLTCSIIVMSSGVMVFADEVDLFGSDRSSEDVLVFPSDDKDPDADILTADDDVVAPDLLDESDDELEIIANDTVEVVDEDDDSSYEIPVTTNVESPEIVIPAGTTYYDYYEMLESGAMASTASTVSGYYLISGVDLVRFNKLKSQISDVANGKRTSTIFDVSLSDLGIAEQYYSAKDLGVKSILDTEGELTEEAMNKLDEIACGNFNLLFCTLISDCPYEMFWFEKVRGAYASGYSYGLRMNYKTGEMEICLMGTVSYFFYVTSDYSSTGKALTFEVSPAQINRAIQASNNAKSIVSKYASLSDYDKLAAYSTEICNLVEYNHDALDKMSDPYYYGDPFQLVYVFDNNPSTNVVCEGYSKAFKYLCDLSSFSSDITCILGEGDVDYGPAGSGGHMWNIVRSGGKNYLVDVTNCDGDVYDDDLFMRNADKVVNSLTYQFNYHNYVFTYEFDDVVTTTFSSNAYSITTDPYAKPSTTTTATPTAKPTTTATPTAKPTTTATPTAKPTTTATPTAKPTTTATPTAKPTTTATPTAKPTTKPTAKPTAKPTGKPSDNGSDLVKPGKDNNNNNKPNRNDNDILKPTNNNNNNKPNRNDNDILKPTNNNNNNNNNKNRDDNDILKPTNNNNNNNPYKPRNNDDDSPFKRKKLVFSWDFFT